MTLPYENYNSYGANISPVTSNIGSSVVSTPTAPTPQFQGRTYGDLSQREKRLARRGVDITSSKYEDPEGGDTGSDISGWMGGLGQVAQIGTTLFGKQYNDNSGFEDEQAAINLASKFGPWGMLGAGIASVSSQVSRGLDVNTSKISKRAKDASGMTGVGRFANNTLNWINNTTFGLWGGFGSIGKTQDYNMSQEAQQLSGAYSGSTNDMMAAEDVAGGRFFFGKSKLNNLVDTAVKNDQLLTQIGIDNDQRVSSVPYNANDVASRNFKKMYGMTGQNYTTRVGKQGMKMLSREELDRIYAAKKVVESDIQKFENGGSIMIPDGKLHANLHHMEDVNPELAEDLTKKGIPVVVTDKDGEVSQVAEIEKEEIILSIDLTKQIEELKKDGSEEAMIKAGKLIVDALLNDSTDNAGLINKIE